MSKIMSLRLKDDMYSQIRELAEQKGLPVSTTIRSLLHEKLKDMENK